MLTGNARPGAPFPHGPAPAEHLVAEIGDFENADGCRVVLLDTHVMFQARFDGGEVTFGCTVEQLLEAIQDYGKRFGS